MLSKTHTHTLIRLNLCPRIFLCSYFLTFWYFIYQVWFLLHLPAFFVNLYTVSETYRFKDLVNFASLEPDQSCHPQQTLLLPLGIATADHQDHYFVLFSSFPTSINPSLPTRQLHLHYLFSAQGRTIHNLYSFTLSTDCSVLLNSPNLNDCFDTIFPIPWLIPKNL